jgi:hypothetical protein
MRMSARIIGHVHHLHRPHIRRPALAFTALTLVCALSGCGTDLGYHETSTVSSVPPAATPTSAKINHATSNFCPSAQPPQDAESFRADIVLNDSGTPTQIVTLDPSQRLEIRIDSQVQWALQINDPAHILVSAQSQGWYDTRSSTCDWRFTAQAAGDAQLIFTGTLPCPPLKTCPSSDRSVTYRLSIR